MGHSQRAAHILQQCRTAHTDQLQPSPSDTLLHSSRLRGFIFCLFLFFLFSPHHTACRILVPRAGIEPTPSPVEAQSLNYWTAREVPDCVFMRSLCPLQRISALGRREELWSVRYPLSLSCSFVPATSGSLRVFFYPPPFFFLIWPLCVACRILVPPPGIEPAPSEVKAPSPNHWTTREFPSFTPLVS